MSFTSDISSSGDEKPNILANEGLTLMNLSPALWKMPSLAFWNISRYRLSLS